MHVDPLRLLRARHGFWLLLVVTLAIFWMECPDPFHPPADYAGFHWLPLLLVPSRQRASSLLGLGCLDLALTLWVLLTGSDQLVQHLVQHMPLRAAVFLLILWLDHLRHSQDYSRQLLESIQASSPMGMALVEGSAGTVLRLNPAMARLLGGNSRKLEGRCWFDFCRTMPSADAPQRQQLFRCDGQPCWVQIGAHPLDRRGQSGQRQLLVIQALDCEASVEAEATLASQAEELRRQLAVSLEACSLSHEIRQPLSLLLLQCRRLLQRLESDAEDPGQPTALHRVSLGDELVELAGVAEQIDATISAMVSLLRSGSSPQDQADLAAVVRTCLRSLQPRLAAAGVQLSSAGLEEPLPLRGNQVQLRIACGNLLLNSLVALRHCPPSERRLLVELRRDGARAELRVSDSGPGLQGRQLHDLTLASSKSEGMGLGLFTTALIAQHHQGRLEVGDSARLGGAELILVVRCPDPPLPAAPLIPPPTRNGAAPRP